LDNPISDLVYFIYFHCSIPYCWLVAMGLRFVVLGHWYFVWYFRSIAVGFVFGQLLLDLWLDKTGRRSIMIFIVAFVTVVATFLMGGAGIYDIVKQVERGVYMGFRSPCL